MPPLWLLLALAQPPANPLAALHGNTPGALAPAEIDALWAVVEQRDNGRAADWLRAAVDAEGAGTRFPWPAQVVHAAVGLDRERRDDLEAWLLGRIRDEASPRPRRVRAALVLLDLGEPSPAFADEVAGCLARAAASRETVGGLLRLRSALRPDRWSAHCLAFGTESAQGTGGDDRLERLSRLTTLASGLDRPDAARLLGDAVADALADWERLRNVVRGDDLANRIVAALDHCDERQAREAARRLTHWALDRIDTPRSAWTARGSIDLLTRLARHLGDDEVADLGPRLRPRLFGDLATNRDRLADLAETTDRLPPLLARWRPDDAGAIYREAAAQLIGAAAIQPLDHEVPTAVAAFARLVRAAPPGHAEAILARAIDLLDAAIRSTTYAPHLAGLADLLAAIDAVQPTAKGGALCRAVGGDLARKLVAVRTANRIVRWTDRVTGPLLAFAFDPVLRIQDAVHSRYGGYQDSVEPYATGYAALARHSPPEEALGHLLQPLIPMRSTFHPAESGTESFSRVLVETLDRLGETDRARLTCRVAGTLSGYLVADGGRGMHSPAVLRRFVGVLEQLEPALAGRLATDLLTWSCQRFREGESATLRDWLPALRRFPPADNLRHLANSAARVVRRAIARADARPDDPFFAESAVLVALAPSLPPELATNLCADLAQLVAVRIPDEVTAGYDEMRLVALAGLLELLPAKDADRFRDRIARRALERSWRGNVRGRRALPLLYPHDSDDRAREVAAWLGQLPGGMPVGVAPAIWLPTAARPLGQPPSAELCVELLKHPLCVGDDRRAVLGALGVRYGRTFLDQWDFVRFAEEGKLGLDLASPPKRSAPERQRGSR